MTMLVAIHDRPALLPFFLRYYAKYGVKRFVYILWMGEDNPIYPEIVQMSQSYDWHMRPYKVHAEDYQPAHDVEAFNLARLEFVQDDEWLLVADLDEFHYYEGFTFQEVTAKADSKGHATVWSVLIDRVAPEGAFPVLRQDLTLDEQFPLAANVMLMVGNSAQKVGMAKGCLPIMVGHHAAGCFGLLMGETHHFKWHGPILDYLKKRYAQQKKISGSVWLSEHQGTFKLMSQPNWISRCAPRPADVIGV